MFGHWFVVASQKTVYIFSEAGTGGELRLVKELDNPLGRERNRALIRKEAGRGIKTSGRVGAVHYSERKRHDPHEEAAVQFAKKTVEFLESEERRGSFKSLTVAAEPRFLGKIKAAMRPETEKLVVEWLRKDLLKVPKADLARRLLSGGGSRAAAVLAARATS